MKLVIDANILVAELTRKRGRALLVNPRLELFIAEKPWKETQHELSKRYRTIAKRTGASTASVTEQYELSYQLAESIMKVLPFKFYKSFADEALQRIPRDPDDWHSIALALALDADIWTQDQDFFGCGIATWTTDTLLIKLNSK